MMLSVTRNREKVLTFVIDYQRSQLKSVFEGERLSEAEMKRREQKAAIAMERQSKRR